ncbi:MAG: transglutaminase domain-containing protein [Akkermansia sp.]|nr:transglutaminase domain-containing protein [Akkermansia sp.]
MGIKLKPSTPTIRPPKRTSKAPVGFIVGILMALGLLGGGGYYYLQMQEQAKAEALARKEAAERRAREAAEARRKAALEAEAARKAREEAKRLAAEEAARKAAEEAERKAAEEAERRRREAEEAERRRREAEEAARRQQADAPAAEPDKEDTPPLSPYAAEVLLTGSDCNLPANVAAFNAMVDELLSRRDFDAFTAAFNPRIKAVMPELINGDKLGHSAYVRCRNLVQAIDLCLLADMAGPEVLREMLTPSGREYRNGPEAPQLFFKWALRDKTQPLHTLLQNFMMNEGNPANMGYAIRLFFDLWERTPERDRGKYLNLAVACSLVSPAVAQSATKVRDANTPPLSMVQVYDYFREKDAAKKLVTDIKKLSVSQLLYVVDVRLPRSEFEWVLKNLKYNQSNWGEAYGSIRYRMDRAAQKVDPYTSYTFEEIRKEGGICMDQAYFAHTTAKCAGIPAVYIVGDGDRGGHAWIASLIDGVSWQQTGSYGYKTGRFANSCSGRWLHESVLLNQTKKTTDEKLEKAADGMLLSAYLMRIGSNAEARGAAKFVTSAYPLLTAGWVNRVRVLSFDEKNMPETEVWRSISQNLMRHGRKNGELIDLATEVEDRYLMDAKSSSAQKSAMKRSMDTLKRTVGEGRSDLVVEAIERQGRLLSEEGDIRGLSVLYKKQLKEFTDRGDIFQQLLGQYMNFMGEEATERQWKAMAKDVEKLFEKHVRTGGGDHFKLSKEVAIQHLIADAYEKAGDSKKAEKIRQDAETRMQASRDRYQAEQ